MSVNPWFLLLALAIGYVMGRRSAWAEATARLTQDVAALMTARSKHTAEGIRKLEAGEYGERLREKWEKLKRENGDG